MSQPGTDAASTPRAPTYSRRIFLRTAVGATGVVLLAACTPAAPSAPTPAPAQPTAAPKPAAAPTQPAAPAPAATAAPAAAPTTAPATSKGATVQATNIRAVFSNIAETKTLDPAITFSSDGILFTRNVYETLLEYAPATTEIRPLLATDWSASDDGLVYTLKLRQGVAFHDGAPFNADAAKQGLERIQKVNQGPATLMSGIKDIAATDESTLKITLNQPDAYFPGKLPRLPIVSPKALKDNAKDSDPLAKDWFATNSAGTGPYKLSNWVRNNRIELAQNDHYWRDWQPGTPDRVVLRVDPDVTTALQLMQQGEVDMTGALGPDESDAASKIPGVKIVKQPSYRVSVLPMLVNRGPLQDKRVRQAVQLAFDYEAMLQFFKGTARAIGGLLPSNAPGYDESLPLPKQDLEQAKQLLSDAGYPGGNGLSLSYLGLQGLSYEEFAGTVLQDGLRKLGVGLEQTIVPWPQMQSLAGDESNAPDISFVNQSMITNDSSSMIRSSFHSDSVASKGGYNWSYYRNPDVDKQLDQVGTIQNEMDRNKLISQIHRTIVEDSPALWIVHQELNQPVRSAWDVTYETLDYNFVIRFFYARKNA